MINTIDAIEAWLKTMGEIPLSPIELSNTAENFDEELDECLAFQVLYEICSARYAKNSTAVWPDFEKLEASALCGLPEKPQRTYLHPSVRLGVPLK